MIIRIDHITPPLCCNALHGSPHEGVGLQHSVEMVHRQGEQIAVGLRPDTEMGSVLNELQQLLSEFETKAIRRFAKVSIVSYSRSSLMTIAFASKFHVYLAWGQRPFSIVS